MGIFQYIDIGYVVTVISSFQIRFYERKTDDTDLGGGGGVKAKTKKSVVLQQILIQKALSQKGEVGGGKCIHFMKALFKTYSKINVWWLLLSE